MVNFLLSLLLGSANYESELSTILCLKEDLTFTSISTAKRLSLTPPLIHSYALGYAHSLEKNDSEQCSLLFSMKNRQKNKLK